MSTVSLTDLLKNVIVPEDHRAVGNNAADDTNAFKEIDAQLTAAAVQGTILCGQRYLIKTGFTTGAFTNIVLLPGATLNVPTGQTLTLAGIVARWDTHANVFPGAGTVTVSGTEVAAVTIDATAADIAPVANALAAGAVGKVADAGHVHTAAAGLALSGPVVSGVAAIGAGVLGFASSQLNVGDGTVNHIVGTLDQTQTLTNKTLTNPTVGGAASTAAGVLGFAASLLSVGDGTASHTVETLDQAQSPTNKTFDSSSNISVRVGFQRLASASSSVSFTSIPGGFNSLLLVCGSLKGNGAGTSLVSLIAQFNSDTGAHYDSSLTGFDGTTAANTETVAGTSALVGAFPEGGTASGTSSNLILWIPNYSQAIAHAIVSSSAAQTAVGTAGSTHIRTGAGFWNPTSAAAITSIVISPSAESFAIGSTFLLYGLA